MPQARATFADLHRAARMARRQKISPEYVQTHDDASLDLTITNGFNNLPVWCRRYSGTTRAARRHRHIAMAADARRRMEGFPAGFLRQLAADDHAGHIRMARHYGRT